MTSETPSDLGTSQCYFCGNLMPSSQLKGHIYICCSVLEKCPNQCGAYVQRREKEVHVEACKTGVRQFTSTETERLRVELQKTKIAIQRDEQLREMWEYDWRSQVAKLDQILQKVEWDLSRMTISYTAMQKKYVDEQEARFKESKLFRQQLSECFKRIFYLERTIKKANLNNKAGFVSNFGGLLENFELLCADYSAWKYRQENKLACLESAIFLKHVTEESFKCRRPVPYLFGMQAKRISEQENCFSQISQCQEEIEAVKVCQKMSSTDVSCEIEINQKLIETRQQIAELAAQQTIIEEKITFIDETLSKNKINIIKIQNDLMLNKFGHSTLI